MGHLRQEERLSPDFLLRSGDVFNPVCSETPGSCLWDFCSHTAESERRLIQIKVSSVTHQQQQPVRTLTADAALGLRRGSDSTFVHEVSGSHGRAPGPLRHSVPADGYGGSAGPESTGRRHRVLQPRAGCDALDRGGNQEQPRDPAG